MLHLFVSVALAQAALQTAQPAGEDPRVVVRAATRAVEGDSASRLVVRYAARVGRNPNDRAARLGLATISRLRYDYPASESAYRQLFNTRDRYAVYARLGLALGQEERSFSRAAGAEFERARSAAREQGDRLAEAEAVLELTFIRGRIEGVALAEALLDSAARLVPDTVFELWSGLRRRRAITLAMRGRAADAVEQAQASAALARRARDPRAEADAYRVLGQVLQYRGEWDSAFAALRRSQELHLQARNRSALATSLIWHAQVLAGMGRYGEMREVMNRALAEGEATHNPAAVADARRAFGVLASMLGDWPAATAQLKQSAAISAESGDSSGVMVTNKFLASAALVAGDIASARKFTLELLAWSQKTQDRGAEYEAQRTLADIAAREKDWPAAERALAAARAQLRVLPGSNRSAWLAHDEARLAQARGDFIAAERWLNAYLAVPFSPSTDFVPFDARVRLADIYARRGELARAEQQLVTATDEIDLWRSKLDDAELRTLAFQAAATSNSAAAEPTGSAAGLARVLAALAAGGRADAAFSLAERWRARELMDRLTRNAALRPEAPQPANGARTSTPVRNAAAMVSAIPNDQTALIEFVASKGAPLTLFVVQRGGIRARVLPQFDSLSEHVARLGALIESGADAAQLSRALGAALIEPALQLLDRRVTRIVIIPDGPLHHLPFDALRLADGRYLLERLAVGYAPSASVVTALWARRPYAQPAASLRMLALGNPVMPQAQRGAPRDAASEDFLAAAKRAGALTRLAGAAREVRLVSRYAGAADVRVGAQASAAFVKQSDLRAYRVLHFATHAIVDEQAVSRTALVLAPGNGESGFVSAGDLAALRLDADLVVLSACRAARGVLVSGEGVQGLTSPLLQAGARTLVATQWRIRDQDAVPFVDALYAALARGLPVADALRAAKLEAIRRGQPARTWAAFLAIGDPLVTIPLRTPPKPWWSRFVRS